MKHVASNNGEAGRSPRSSPVREGNTHWLFDILALLKGPREIHTAKQTGGGLTVRGSRGAISVSLVSSKPSKTMCKVMHKARARGFAQIWVKWVKSGGSEVQWVGGIRPLDTCPCVVHGSWGFAAGFSLKVAVPAVVGDMHLLGTA